MIEYHVGDVIEGFFSCYPSIKARAIVRGRVPTDGRSPAGFYGDSIDYVPHKGWGVWGYDSEVKVARPSTPQDELAAVAVRHRVSADTDRILNRA